MLVGIGVSVTLSLVILYMIGRRKLNKIKNWQVGDIICLTNNKLSVTQHAAAVHSMKQPLAALIKWDYKEVMVKLADGTHWFLKHKSVKNLSYNTRTTVEKMDQFMGRQNIAIFPPQQLPADNQFRYNNKTIAELPDNDLNDLLIVLEGTEDYELMAEIKKELDKRKETKNK